MTMRFSTMREVAGSDRSTFNQPITTPTVILTNAPCYWQSDTERTIADGQKLVALGTHFVMAPLGTNILELDHITSVVDRRGRAKVSNRLRVVAAVNREDHIEVTAEEYS